MQHVAILISGRGSNMQSLVEALSQQDLKLTVVANRKDASGLEYARQHALETLVIEHRLFATREAFDAALHQALAERAVDWVLLAGFMRILSAGFVKLWSGRLVNIHPSRLPKYPGLDTHQRALDAGDETAGASVHFVTEELDGGPVIIQSIVKIHTQDDADALARRVLASEHAIYPLAAKWVLDGHAKLCKDQVCLDDRPITAPVLWHDGELSYPVPINMTNNPQEPS